MTSTLKWAKICPPFGRGHYMNAINTINPTNAINSQRCL